MEDLTASGGARVDAVPGAGTPPERPSFEGPVPKISVVVPTLNEAANLPHVFALLPTDLHEVILVDGYSTDGTMEAARALRPDIVVIEQTRPGKGNALACGFEAVTGDIVVMLDADGSADPREIPAFVQALQDGADFAKGSRFRPGGGSTDITKTRRVGNWGLNQLVNLLYGTGYSDLCYGYNAFWTYCLPRLRVDCDGFEVETLINVRAAKAGLRVTEVPSFEHPRLHGHSKLNVVRDGNRVLRTLLRERVSPTIDVSDQPVELFGEEDLDLPAVVDAAEVSAEPSRFLGPGRGGVGSQALTAEATWRGRSRRLRSEAALGLADAGAGIVAGGLVVLLDGTVLATAPLLASAAVLALARVMGLQSDDGVRLRKTTLEEIPQLTLLAGISTLLGWWATGAVGEAVSATVALGFFGTLLGSLTSFRGVARSVAGRFGPAERCLLIGKDGPSHTLRAKLEEDGMGATVVAQLALSDLVIERAHTAGPTGRMLQRLVVAHDINRLVVSSEAADNRDAVDLLREARALGLNVSVLPRLGQVVGAQTRFETVGGMTLMAVQTAGMRRSTRRVKRVFDVTGAGLGLIALTPVLALISVAVKTTSPGKLLFRQRRVGRYGQEFEILKFRVTPNGVEDDEQLTRVGKILRRGALDELPQLVNVLRGEMSLVGPRPLLLEEDEHIHGWDRDRLQLTPGMTGQWQISGTARLPLREMVTIDYLYVTNWSLWTDVKILVRTVGYVLSRRPPR